VPRVQHQHHVPNGSRPHEVDGLEEGLQQKELVRHMAAQEQIHAARPRVPAQRHRRGEGESWVCTREGEGLVGKQGRGGGVGWGHSWRRHPCVEGERGRGGGSYLYVLSICPRRPPRRGPSGVPLASPGGAQGDTGALDCRQSSTQGRKQEGRMERGGERPYIKCPQCKASFLFSIMTLYYQRGFWFPPLRLARSAKVRPVLPRVRRQAAEGS